MHKIPLKMTVEQPLARISPKPLKTLELVRQAKILLHIEGVLPVDWQEELVRRLSVLSEQLYDARLIPK